MIALVAALADIVLRFGGALFELALIGIVGLGATQVVCRGIEALVTLFEWITGGRR